MKVNFLIENPQSLHYPYKDSNPYLEKLKELPDFVITNEDTEKYRSKWHQVFNNDDEIVLEIGSGYGNFLINYCKHFPQHNFIGMEYRFKRSHQLAVQVAKHIEDRCKIKLLRANALRISKIFGPGELSHVFLFFPDPWPKSRHHKKRIFQIEFLDEMNKILQLGGKIIVKTDHDEYFEHMLEVINSEISLNYFKLELMTKDLYESHKDHFLTQFPTKFEKIFLKQNIKIKALILSKLSIKHTET